MGRRLLFVLCLLGLFALPGRAGAATIPLTHCGQTQGLECGTVDVPLDRSGAVPGTIGLHVEMLPGGPFAKGTIFLLAGGPGQGSATVFDLGTPDNADFWQALFPGYTIVAFDNRGTGKSGVISCPALQNTTEGTAEEFAALARDCAVSIGTTRQFYATRDHAEDMESVRVALGLGKIGIYGVSYGTKLALAYALAHPDEVDRIVLNSVLPVGFPDAFDSNVLQQLPSKLREFCAGGVCARATKDFAGEFVRLANQLEAKPVSATVFAIGGGKKVQRMNGEDLVTLAEDSDLNPGLAAELPAAVHAALHGNVRPLVRLHYLDLFSEVTPTDQLSFGLNAATNCADGQFPWSPDTPVSARQSAIDSAVAALPDSAFGPFGRWAARLGLAYFCEQWPSPAGRAPLGSGPLPNVPVLIISGGYDIRTPTNDAQQIAAMFPQSHLLVVPGVGHDPVDADLTYCAAKAVRDWNNGASVPASCPRVPNWAKVLGTFPRRGGRAPATTLSVAGKAIREAEATWVTMVFSPPARVGGIYGGIEAIGSGLTFSLKSYSDTPGVALTGKLTVAPGSLPFAFTGTVRVTGSASASGTLHIKGAKATGTLGGRHVSGRI